MPHRTLTTPLKSRLLIPPSRSIAATLKSIVPPAMSIATALKTVRAPRVIPAFTAPTALRPRLGGRAPLVRLLRQQQRRATLGQARQRCGNLNRRNIPLTLKLLDELAVRRALARIHRLGNTLLEPCDPLLIDSGDRGQSHLLDGLPRRALNDAQHVALTWSNEQDGLTLSARTPRAPDTVDV
jgi:hypothetical protein